ncbi:efflux transporter outer membrane subunit [Pantoea sp. 18069]|uniref:efflux transporter outer membrane subunit n=1 Tax=Pantoea sp. 18069 TaxID=2681415 RepID=UPI00190FB0A5|nr:efflux transporter outer membrane subunit [Pantoea sp. 18069]
MNVGLNRKMGVVVMALVLAGCAAPTPPASGAAMMALPTQWRGDAVASPVGISADWWRSFGSAELDTLVHQAQAQSLNVAAAVARVQQAGALARIAGAALLPEVGAGLNASRQQRMGGNASVDGRLFGAGLSASYEIDFWGRNRAGQGSALATLQASAFERDTLQLTVTAGVATAWLQAVALRERIAIGERNLQSAARLLALVESRVRAGAATPLELAQQRGLVAGQRRGVEALRQQAGDARSALALLLGQSGGPAIATQTLAALQAPAIGAGLPVELLTRRPDIARAEAQLVAADANLLAARAALLPRLTLTGGIASGADRLRRVFDNPLYSLAAGLAAPVFDAGRLAAGRDLARARREELLANYRAAIFAAFADVEVALNAVAGVAAQSAAQAEELTQAQRALTLAERRYRAGDYSLLTLLDAQRTLYAAQDAAVQLQALGLQASVALYKALGGGWSRPAEAALAANSMTIEGLTP